MTDPAKDQPESSEDMHVIKGESIAVAGKQTSPKRQRSKALAVTPATMLQTAVEQGADLDKLEQLMGLHERWEANEARKAFVVAMTAFKENPPKITRDRHVNFTTPKGTTDYKHASLDQVSASIGKALGEHGIVHDWETEQLDGGLIKVTCVLTHCMGHTKRVSLQSSPDQTGNKNNIQAIGSATSYLSRYTLLLAVGMAAQDDDGQTAEPDGRPEPTRAEYTNSAGPLFTLLDEFGEQITQGSRDEFVNKIQEEIDRFASDGNTNRLKTFYEFNEVEIAKLGDTRDSEDRRTINQAFNAAKTELPAEETADGE